MIFKNKELFWVIKHILKAPILSYSVALLICFASFCEILALQVVISGLICSVNIRMCTVLQHCTKNPCSLEFMVRLVGEKS